MGSSRRSSPRSTDRGEVFEGHGDVIKLRVYVARKRRRKIRVENTGDRRADGLQERFSFVFVEVNFENIVSLAWNIVLQNTTM